MAKVIIHEETCKGCGLCVDACPRGVLAINKERINQKGYNPVHPVNPGVLQQTEKSVLFFSCQQMLRPITLTLYSKSIRHLIQLKPFYLQVRFRLYPLGAVSFCFVILRQFCKLVQHLMHFDQRTLPQIATYLQRRVI